MAKTGDRIMLIGMPEIKHTLDGVDALCLPRGGRLGFRLEELATMYSKRCISQSTQDPRLLGCYVESPDGRLHICSQGLPLMVVDAYFQDASATTNDVPSKLLPRTMHTQRAEQLLRQRSLSWESTFFIHVRSTDYASWPNSDAPALLPGDWYREAADWIRDNTNLRESIVVSDSVQAAKAVADDTRSSAWLVGEPSASFALMASLPGGAISASTFSWWASLFSWRQDPDRLFVAPMFWGGHRLKRWFPPHMMTQFLCYLPVREGKPASSL